MGSSFGTKKSSEVQCSLLVYLYIYIFYLFPCILILCPSELWAVCCLPLYLSAGYQTFRVSFAAPVCLKRLWVLYQDSLNLNLVRQGRDSKQKPSRVSQLPSYQSQDLISFLKAPIVFCKDCEIVTCWVTVTGRAAGLAGTALLEQLTAVHQDGRCEDLTPPSPGHSMGSCCGQPGWDFARQVPFQVWITSIFSKRVSCSFTQAIPQRNMCQTFDPGYWLKRKILCQGLNNISSCGWEWMHQSESFDGQIAHNLMFFLTLGTTLCIFSLFIGRHLLHTAVRFLVFISLSVAVQVTSPLSFPTGDFSTTLKYVVPSINTEISDCFVSVSLLLNLSWYIVTEWYHFFYF